MQATPDHGVPARQRHVFLEELRGEPLDFSRRAGAFEIVSPARLQEYRDALPPEWVKDGNAVGEILEYIVALRDNIDGAIKQLVGALQ